MSTPPVLTAIADGIGTITLNRPEARNALSKDMRPALAAAVTQMRDDPQVYAVILTGAGGAFCSGGDISGMLDSTRTVSRCRSSRSNCTRSYHITSSS